jgi:signal peptidase I
VKNLIKAKIWMSRIITSILFLSLLFMAFVVISSKASGGEPNILGYQLKTVLSGSMEPSIQTGSIIAIKPGGDMTRFQKGDVITFIKEDNSLVTHRVLEVRGQGEQTQYLTKGDHNEDPDKDPILSQNVVGEYKGFTIPILGYVMDFAKSKEGTAMLLILPGLFLLIYSGITVWQTVRELDPSKNKETTING